MACPRYTRHIEHFGQQPVHAEPGAIRVSRFWGIDLYVTLAVTFSQAYELGTAGAAADGNGDASLWDGDGLPIFLHGVQRQRISVNRRCPGDFQLVIFN